MSHSLLFIANNNIGYGLSGGDTIFIELLKNWQTKNNITLLACQEAIDILPPSIKHVKYIISDTINPNPNNHVLNLFFHYVRRLIRGVSSILKNKTKFSKLEYVYTVSDFLPDLIPGLLLKLMYPQIKLITGYYLFAPHPFSSNSPYSGIHRLKGLVYWSIQQITRPLVNIYADYIFITSAPDKIRFSTDKQVIIIRGGVDYIDIKQYINDHPLKPLSKRTFDACFLGRFHPQKGCLKLIKIWYKLSQKLPHAKLAIIGQGEQEAAMRSLVNRYKLQKNIKFFGFQIGQPKYKIFSDSKLVVHPATYDSGGMASAEALAFGLPGVSFDLESLKTYYPKGFLKSKCFSTKSFSDNIYKLLTNRNIYQKLSHESIKLVESQWDWTKRAHEIYSSITYNQL